VLSCLANRDQFARDWDGDVSTNESATGDTGGQILQFRRRGRESIRFPRLMRNESADGPSPISDLSEFEQTPDNYGQRMIVNALAFAFTVALMVTGIWLADSMAEVRKKQDCALMGRQNCAQITSPTIVHW
jgi:hypothetical protein